MFGLVWWEDQNQKSFVFYEIKSWLEKLPLLSTPNLFVQNN